MSVTCPACGAHLGVGRWKEQELIPNDRLRALVLARVADGYRWSELARAVYGVTEKRKVDSCRARLRRALGVWTPRGAPPQRSVTYELAQRIVTALKADPIDYGL